MPALLLLLLVLALLPAAPAGATAPGKNGAIAFVGHRGPDPVLFIRRSGRTVGLLRGDGLADPAWSPAGRRLALTREVPGVGRAVWILNADGTGLRQLTASELAGSAPAWAPSGRRLAFAAGPVGARTIHVIKADGTGEHAITAGADDERDPSWSAKDRIVYTATTPTGADVFTVPSAGGTPRRLTFKPGDDTDPVWSPRGDQIAFVRGTGGVWVMSRYGRGARRVAHVPGGMEQGIAWAPDGSRLVFAGGKPGRRQIYSAGLDGKGLRTLSLPTSDGEDPDWQSTGHFPVIAAAGDIACSPTGASFNGGLGKPGLCAMGRTSDLLLQPDLAAVLVLGDEQYEQGQLDGFYASFGPSWGRLGPLLRPVPGNHEYRTPGAQGYYDYFNGSGVQRGRAGDRARGGYYSFDIGTWHLVALDSNCASIPGGCSTGSPQQQWLERDLRQHRSHCTLAFWHHPLYSSRASEEGRGSPEVRDLYRTLHAAGADVVLNGHQHFYERLAPQDPDGNLDRAHGLRTFVVGTGGKSLDQADFRDRNSQAFSADTYGVLELTLRPNGLDWHFRGAGPVAYFDSGRAPCH
ncbi:MAG: Alkaline phosphatase [Solirubrobacterales bacterium]|nr:Alkaline phosphatase [Solirubrobacterales bacterium]